MALEEFEREEPNERDKGYQRMRSIMDYGMGILWAAMGVFFIFIKHFNADLAAKYDDITFKIFGSICILYGLFRIYRGYRKNYFRDR
ncbi:MAG: hypothetical protein JNM14_10820 [Ferruginibacter sp.]|nr:hypothetical protein [Ferruginibacter sp.]